MRQNRALSLKREVLTELTPAEMTAINGGTHAGCNTTGQVTHASFDSPCPTIPLNDCVISLPIGECIAFESVRCTR